MVDVVVLDESLVTVLDAKVVDESLVVDELVVVSSLHCSIEDIFICWM